jgi:hypothetical protein
LYAFNDLQLAHTLGPHASSLPAQPKGLPWKRSSICTQVKHPPCATTRSAWHPDNRAGSQHVIHIPYRCWTLVAVLDVLIAAFLPCAPAPPRHQLPGFSCRPSCCLNSTGYRMAPRGPAECGCAVRRWLPQSRQRWIRQGCTVTCSRAELCSWSACAHEPGGSCQFKQAKLALTNAFALSAAARRVACMRTLLA